MDGHDSNNSNPLSKKIEKILNSEFETDTLNALKNVSYLITDNTLTTRRNLRAKIEEESININKEFFSELNNVYLTFQQLSDCISFISNSSQNLLKKIENLKLQSSKFMGEADKINSELVTLDENEKTLTTFLEDFSLSPEELALLNPDTKVDDSFFEILNKIRKIHENAKTTLASNQLITGFEIMDSMSKYEEMGSEKLYRWTVNILRTANLDFIELHSHLFNALAYLQSKEALFKHCLDEYTIVRRCGVTHRFIEALTRGRSSNNTNYPAMEFYSNDIVRYIRDMFSFLHQTFVFERDMLKTLLKACNQEELAKKNILKNVISTITEGVIRILKTRVENCLITNDRTGFQGIQIKRTKNFFQVKNIVNFYLHTFTQVLNEDCAFVYFIKELLVSSDKVFYNSLKFYCTQLDQKDDFVQSKINMAKSKEHLSRYIILIDELLDGVKSSINFNVQEQQLETQRILSYILESSTQYIIVTSSKLFSIEMTIFQLNCFNILKKTIEKYKFTESFLDNLQKQINESLEILVNEQFQSIISSLAMNSLFNALNQNTNGVKIPLSTLSGCDPIAIATFLNNFDKFIQNPKQLSMKRLEDVNDETIRENIWRNSLQLISDTYEKVYQLLIDPENKYSDIDLIKHKPDYVANILKK